jgi:hypothetical protein
MTDFLTALYGDIPDGHWFYIWTLDDDTKQTHWFQDVAPAVKLAKQTTKANVYWPIGLRTQRLTHSQRGEERDIAAIIAFVADVDFQDETHPYAPADEPAAMKLIDAFPLRPSALVHSGHGLQATWLFKEPWTFDDHEERLEAKQLSMAWWHTLSTIASRQSYELDAVHDLTRVMRVPGTMNVKDRPVPVELRWLGPKRYNPPDFEPYLAELPVTQTTQPLPAVDLNAEFPAEKHKALCANIKEFERTWQHTREMPRDNSCSGYEMSLAATMVQAGWSDDEITATLRDHRRRWGQDKPDKITNANHYARTIAKCRASQRDTEARLEADDIIGGGNGLAEPQERLKAIATRLDMPLTHVQVVSGEPGIMRLWIGGKCAEVLLTALDTPAATYKAVINTARTYPLPIARKEKPGWRDIVNTLLECAEEVEAGDDATVEGDFYNFLLSFFDARPPLDCPEGELVEFASNPFRRGGYIWFRLEDLIQYMRSFDRRVDRKETAQRLRLLGAQNKPHQVQIDRKQSRAMRFYGISKKKIDGDEV